jgi:tRNA-Thr(GGU) m(6)t(6)A37 methyltransferase TsaA
MSQTRPPVEVTPIGVVRSPFTRPQDAPKQGPERDTESIIEIDPAWQEGLSHLEPGSDIWVLCHLTPRLPLAMLVHPRGDAHAPRRGLFTTRSPHRPSPISLTLVHLNSLEAGRLKVRGLDMVDGTLVLDIKPYVAMVDRPRKYEA